MLCIEADANHQLIFLSKWRAAWSLVQSCSGSGNCSSGPCNILGGLRLGLVTRHGLLQWLLHVVYGTKTSLAQSWNVFASLGYNRFTITAPSTMVTGYEGPEPLSSMGVKCYKQCKSLILSQLTACPSVIMMVDRCVQWIVERRASFYYSEMLFTAVCLASPD